MKHVMPVILALAMVGCHSLWGPVMHLKPDYAALPAEEFRQVALEIEQAVQKGDRNPQIADRAGIVVNDEVVLQAIRTRAARSELVNGLLDKGYAWEKGNGHLYLIANSAYKKATARHERDMNALVVTEEAKNRWAMYEGILKASHYPPAALGALQSMFHEARMACMKPGQKYEDDAGNVAVK